jgi:predicted nucleotidyltransferase
MAVVASPFPDAVPERVRALARSVADRVHAVLGPDVRVIWFGSWVRGDADPHSDIDLAVDAERPLPAREVARLRAWIEELPTLYRIDLVNLQEAAPELVAEVRGHGVVLD